MPPTTSCQPTADSRQKVTVVGYSPREKTTVKLLRTLKTDFSLIFACLVAMAVIIMSEMAFHASEQARGDVLVERKLRISINAVQKNMLDLETGQRGYLLTGDARYLEPYKAALKEFNKNLEGLRESLKQHPDQMQTFYLLSTALAKKLAECAITIELRRVGSDNSWKDIVLTDLGKNDMDAARGHIQLLVAASSKRLADYDKVIVQTADIARRGIALLAALGLSAFFFYLKTVQRLRRTEAAQQTALKQERDKLENLVAQRTESLNDLATHLQDVRENERSHLARELHDELGALLTAAKLNVMRVKSRLDPGAAELQERIQELTQILNDGIALKRRIVENLRPTSLDQLGLCAALEMLCTDTAANLGIAMHHNLQPVPLSKEAELTVYRLVQEALTNISKYAQARVVNVSLAGAGGRPNGMATVSVQDDGRGFNLATVRAAQHGLLGMRVRVESHAGILMIDSAPGGGTRITAQLPTAGLPMPRHD